MREKFIYIFLFLACPIVFGQHEIDPLITKDSLAQRIWVDSIMGEMSIDEKIGQLFIVQAYSNKGEDHQNSIRRLIHKYHVGGVIFMQGTPEKQVLLTNNYQSIAKIPLLVGIDGEWGLNMRLTDAYRFPWNMTLGAVEDEALIEKFGARLGEQCKRMGIHFNFAPVVDVNINPLNPIIGNRSFGEKPETVAQKSIAFTRGMQSQHVLATAKHFPGHGDTASDSHKTLPQLNFDMNRLDSVELYPYKELIKNGLTGVMVAHLSVPALEPNSSLPTSLSFNTVTQLLKTKMDFNGLIITDALGMKGVSDFAEPGAVDLAAFLAGNDMLLIPQNLSVAFENLKLALETKIISEERLNHSVKKILKAKYWAGLNRFDFVNSENLMKDLVTVEDEILHRSLVEHSITLLKNEESIIPIRDLDKKRIAYVKFGDAPYSDFLRMLKNYTTVDEIYSQNLDEMLLKLEDYDLVFIGFHRSNAHPWKAYDFEDDDINWIQEIARNKQVVLNIFTSPYSLNAIRTFKNIESVVVSYQNSTQSQEITAQIMFGALPALGKSPVAVTDQFNVGTGIETKTLNRLGYSLAERVGLNSVALKTIDTIANRVIDEKMAPGVQVLVARKGQVVYSKSFGTHTDQKKDAVKNTDLFDLASMTKILTSLPLLMELEERKVFGLETTLGELLPELSESNKDTLTVREVLSHHGRVFPWIPFYLETLDSITHLPSEEYYRSKPSDSFRIQVAEELFLRSDFTDSIIEKIKLVDQRTQNGYRYSDLPYYLFKEYMERYYGKSLKTLSDERFYNSLGAHTLTYHPLEKFEKKEIVPSEDDQYFRYQVLHGHVHDMGAAMQGGIGGHAGLFGNANDVAKMMQLYLQRGIYGGVRYFEEETIDKFNYRYYAHDKNRRGLGFDKTQLREEEKATCGCVSDSSFGHSGFTGTYTWADPETEIVYVFLSNRVYPTMENSALIDENIRTEIQQIIQDAILDQPE